MATLTVFADASDGYIGSVNSSYATARAGSTLSANPTGDLRPGQIFQTPNYYIQEAFVQFDTSPIGSGSVVNSAALSLYGWSDDSGTNFVIEARLHDWGATLDTSDWVAGASLTTKALLASINSSAYANAYMTLANTGTALKDNINKTGFTRILLNSDRHAAGTVPVGLEQVIFYDADQAGTTTDPKLVITFDAVPPVPTTVIPAASSTINTDTPMLGMTLVADANVSQQWGEWQIASNISFTTNVKTVSQTVGQAIASGAITQQLPNASQLFQGTWYIRARALAPSSLASAWSATQSFTISHPPAAANPTPTGGQFVAYGGSGTVTFDWDFSDTSPTDTQTAYQVLLERNSDGLSIWDSGKVSSVASSASYNVAAGYKDIDLRWRVRLWDSDDVVGSYSANQVFQIADASTVSVTSPAEGGVINNPQPTVTWTFTPVGARTQVSYRVLITKAGATEYDSGWITSAATSHPLATPALTNAGTDVVTVYVRDSATFESSDSNNFTTSWAAPAAPTCTVDGSDFASGGYVTVAWTNSVQDANWLSYRIYRRLADEITWTMLGEDFTTAVNYTFDDYTAAAAEYEYAVVQVSSAFGVGVESAYVPTGLSLVGDSYWIVDEEYPSQSIKIYHVISDSFGDEIEQAEMNLIGRGRHNDVGEDWGVRGQITCELWEQTDKTAREQRIALQDWKKSGRALYLRTPFGDYWRIAVPSMTIDRIAGTGLLEAAKVSFDYAEVYDDSDT